jgi:hypothetical protein
MIHMTRQLAILIAAPLVLAAGSAYAGGGEGVAVKVTNDGTEDLIVTVYDDSLGPHAVVLAHAHINGFTTVPVELSPNASGRAKVSWTAMSTDANFRKCGHADEVEVGDESSISVHADSSCSAST